MKKPFSEAAWYATANALFEHAHDVCDRIASAHPLYEPACRMPELVEESDPIIHHTFDAGEGVLIPAEIIHHANHGCEAFLILQPFGCLPNHVVGRGIVKRLRELYPQVQILSLDYDPDVSFANIENRLQMLVMNVRDAQDISSERVDLDALTQAVDEVVEESEELADHVLSLSAKYWKNGEPLPENMSAAISAMRGVLEREDVLAARAKDALVAARKAAQSGASDAAATVIEQALEAAELTREMRTRTHAVLGQVSNLSENMQESRSEAIARFQDEMRARILESRAAAVRIRKRARAMRN